MIAPHFYDGFLSNTAMVKRSVKKICVRVKKISPSLFRGDFGPKPALYHIFIQCAVYQIIRMQALRLPCLK
ncbi:MAG: hypothetical protein COC08_07640 [Maribacter sp.]|nr:MAG: hypothetical protein COC08_07640 [Maribacter sp.]